MGLVHTNVLVPSSTSNILVLTHGTLAYQSALRRRRKEGRKRREAPNKLWLMADMSKL